MDGLPPDIAKRLLNKDLANLIKRVHAGGKLSRQERTMLQNLASATTANNDPPFARNLVELAEVLHVTRQSLNKWKKRSDAPKAAPNGLHDVAAWRDWMRRHDIKSDEAPQTDIDAALRARKLLAEVEERELKVAVRKGLYIPIEQVKHEWGTRIGKAVALLRNKFENELPPILSGLDAAGIQLENREAIDEVLTILSGNE